MKIFLFFGLFFMGCIDVSTPTPDPDLDQGRDGVYMYTLVDAAVESGVDQGVLSDVSVVDAEVDVGDPYTECIADIVKNFAPCRRVPEHPNCVGPTLTCYYDQEEMQEAQIICLDAYCDWWSSHPQDAGIN